MSKDPTFPMPDAGAGQGATVTDTSCAPVSVHLMNARRPSMRLPLEMARWTSSPT